MHLFYDQNKLALMGSNIFQCQGFNNLPFFLTSWSECHIWLHPLSPFIVNCAVTAVSLLKMQIQVAFVLTCRALTYPWKVSSGITDLTGSNGPSQNLCLNRKKFLF